MVRVALAIVSRVRAGYGCTLPRMRTGRK